MRTWKRDHHIRRTVLCLRAHSSREKERKGEMWTRNSEFKRCQCRVFFLLFSFLSPRRACLQVNSVQVFKDENCVGVCIKFQRCKWTFKKNFSGFKFWLRNEMEGVSNWFSSGLGLYSPSAESNTIACELPDNTTFLTFQCSFEADL